MQKQRRQVVGVALAFAVSLGVLTFAPGVRAAIDIASVLKLFGISHLVDLFDTQLDSFINTITFNKGLGKGEATKVVPIVSVGTGAYVGAAQVTGPKAQVAKVQAVGQLEGDFFADSVRAKALVPLDSKNPLQGMRRVDQVGVSAIIDITIESPDPAPQPAPAPAPPASGGKSGGETRTMPAPVRNDSGSVLRRYPALGYAVFASDDISISGNNVKVDGDIRANDDVELKGNNVQVDGDILAGDNIEGKGWSKGKSRGGRNQEHVSKLSLPRFSWTDLERRAGRVYGGSVTLKSGNRLQGITAVSGNLVVDGRLQGGGLVIVSGDVTITRRGAAADDGLLIWARGSVKVPEANTDIRAVILSEGDIKVTGSNVSVRGGLIGRKVQLSGNNLRIVDDSSALRYFPY